MDCRQTPGGEIYGGNQLCANSWHINGDAFCDVTSLLEDSRGRIWLGTAKRGIYRWQAGSFAKMSDVSLDQRIIFAHGQRITKARSGWGQNWD